MLNNNALTRYNPSIEEKCKHLKETEECVKNALNFIEKKEKDPKKNPFYRNGKIGGSLSIHLNEEEVKKVLKKVIKNKDDCDCGEKAKKRIYKLHRELKEKVEFCTDLEKKNKDGVNSNVIDFQQSQITTRGSSSNVVVSPSTVVDFMNSPKAIELARGMSRMVEETGKSFEYKIEMPTKDGETISHSLICRKD